MLRRDTADLNEEKKLMEGRERGHAEDAGASETGVSGRPGLSGAVVVAASTAS